VIADSGRKFGVIEYELICDYSSQIGSPRPIDFDHLPEPEEA
jgi:hypothetical protein